MRRFVLSNSKGVTLIELLAALVIFTIMMTLLFNVLTSSMKHFEISKNKISLSQEANLILAEITKLHQTKATYTLSFEGTPPGNEFKINGGLIADGNYTFDIKAGQVDYDVLNGTLVVDTEKPLFIDFTIINPVDSQQYNVKTVINRY